MTDARTEAEWTAVFLAAAELTRRGHRVNLTLGPDAPLADLVVRTPGGSDIIVDVKGKRRTGERVVQSKPKTPELFLVLGRLGRRPAPPAGGRTASTSCRWPRRCD